MQKSIKHAQDARVQSSIDFYSTFVSVCIYNIEWHFQQVIERIQRAHVSDLYFATYLHTVNTTPNLTTQTAKRCNPNA